MIAGLLLSVAVYALAPSEPVVVQEEVTEVLVVAGDVRVEGKVFGNVVVLLGDVSLASDARVQGDVLVLGGSLMGQGQVMGRKVVLGGTGTQGLVGWAVTFLRLGLWLSLCFLLLFLAPFQVRDLAQEVGRAPLGSFISGVALALAWFSVTLVAGLLTGGVVRVVLWLLLTALLLLAKIFGMVGLFWLFGKQLRLYLPLPLRGEFPRTALAATVLFLFALLPVLGGAVWAAAGILGFGGVMRKLFGPQVILLPQIARKLPGQPV